MIRDETLAKCQQATELMETALVLLDECGKNVAAAKLDAAISELGLRGPSDMIIEENCV